MYQIQYFRNFIFEDHPIKPSRGFRKCSSHIAIFSPCKRLSIIDHKRHQCDTACYGFSIDIIDSGTIISMVLATLDDLQADLCIKIAHNTLSRELKTGQFQRSGHAHLPQGLPT